MTEPTTSHLEAPIKCAHCTLPYSADNTLLRSLTNHLTSPTPVQHLPWGSLQVQRLRRGLVLRPHAPGVRLEEAQALLQGRAGGARPPHRHRRPRRRRRRPTSLSRSSSSIGRTEVSSHTSALGGSVQGRELQRPHVRGLGDAHRQRPQPQRPPPGPLYPNPLPFPFPTSPLIVPAVVRPTPCRPGPSSSPPPNKVPSL